MNTVLEEAYRKAGRRTKHSIQNIPLRELFWGKEHEEAFKCLHETICKAVVLSFADKDKKILCVYRCIG